MQKTMFFLIAELLLPRLAVAQVPVNNDEFRFVLDTMRQERQKIRSGICRITGRYKITDPRKADAQIFDGPLRIFAAYDGDKRRFDRSQPDWVTDPTSVRPHPTGEAGRATASSMKGIESSRFCDNGRKAAIWNESGGGPINIVSSPGDQPIRFGFLRYFDPRAIGLYHRFALDRQDNFKAIFDSHYSTKIKTRKIQKDNIWEIHWDYGMEIADAQTILSVDAANGFTPVQFRFLQRPINNASAEWVTVQDSRTQWKYVSDVWIPVKHTYFETSLGAAPLVEMDMNMAWERINESIEEEMFHWKGFGAPDHVGVSDSSLGASIVVRNATLPVSTYWTMRQRVGVGLAVASFFIVAFAVFRQRIVSSRKKARLSAERRAS